MRRETEEEGMGRERETGGSGGSSSGHGKRSCLSHATDATDRRRLVVYYCPHSAATSILDSQPDTNSQVKPSKAK